MTVYVIRNWKHNFEVSQSRKVEGALSWVALPCKHDGLGYRRIMALPDGPAVYGAWVLIVQVAAKCPLRGTLADERGPLTSEELAFKTGCSQAMFDRALEILTSERVGWILVAEWEPTGIHLPTQDRTRQNSTEQNKTRESVSATADAPSVELRRWLDWWNRLRAGNLVHAGVDAESPSEAVRKAWKRANETREVRDLLADPDRLEKAIRESSFCNAGWFTLPKLFGGKNKTGEYIIARLLEGGYRDAESRRNGRQSAGKEYDPHAKGDL